jgi:hypothetical protein
MVTVPVKLPPPVTLPVIGKVTAPAAFAELPPLPDWSARAAANGTRRASASSALANLVKARFMVDSFQVKRTKAAEGGAAAC